MTSPVKLAEITTLIYETSA